jgi:RNA polymerase sigma-70 factor (ECF subfamily)
VTPDFDELYRAESRRVFATLGRKDEAIASYEKALALSRQEPERRFLRRRIDQLG